MADRAPELHVKGLLKQLDTVSASAAALRQQAQQLAVSLSPASGALPQSVPAPVSKA